MTKQPLQFYGAPHTFKHRLVVELLIRQPEILVSNPKVNPKRIGEIVPHCLSVKPGFLLLRHSSMLAFYFNAGLPEVDLTFLSPK